VISIRLILWVLIEGSNIMQEKLIY